MKFRSLSLRLPFVRLTLTTRSLSEEERLAELDAQVAIAESAEVIVTTTMQHADPDTHRGAPGGGDVDPHR